MANTRRESTASHRSEDATDAAESSPIPALGLDPHLSTADHAVRQETSRLALPIRVRERFLITRTVDIAFALHNKTNGSTISLIHGDMAGRRFFSVSIYPERTVEFWARPSWEELFAFTKANLNELRKPGHALGTWFNDRHLVHVVDVVVCVPERGAALDLGFRFGQLSIFDLEARREVPVPHPFPVSGELHEAAND